MKSSLNKTVNVISGLVQKYVVINNKVKQNTLNQQNYQQLENRLTNLEKLFSDNSGGGDDEIDINDVLTNPTNYAVVINGAVYDILDNSGNTTDTIDESGTYDSCYHHRAGIDEPLDPEEPDADYIVWSRTDYAMPCFIHDPNSIAYGTAGHQWCIYQSGDIIWYCDDEIPGPSSEWTWAFDIDRRYFTPTGNVSVTFIKK